MSRLVSGILIALILVSLAATRSNRVVAQESESKTFTSSNGLFTFQYPGDWVLDETASVARLVSFATAEQAFQVRVEVIFPGSSGMSVGAYAGIPPADIIEQFRVNLAGSFTLGPTTPDNAGGKAIAYATTQAGAIAPELPTDILLLTMDLGGNNVGLMYAETSNGGLSATLTALKAIAGSAVYSGPAVTPVVQQPVVTQPSAPQQPPASTDGTPAAPQGPAVQQPPRATGQVHLFYADGTMTIYNGGDTPVSIAGIQLVVPGTTNNFGANDYGYIFQRLFIPDSCIFLHLATQPFSAPDFCRKTGTRQLTYLFGDTGERFFAWNSSFNTGATFLVMQGETTLATCTIAAGECTFEAPVRYIPFEPNNGYLP